MVAAVVVTGASRGFGRAVAIAISAELGVKQKSADFYLWARNVAKLKDTEAAVKTAAHKYNTSVRTFLTSVDLSSQASYVGQVETLVKQLHAQSPAYEDIYIIHNAATLGHLGCTEVWDSAAELAEYWELNLNSVCFFNARVLAAFRGHALTHVKLINISSGVATSAIAGSGLYCTGKAAREMHFRVIAEENKSSDQVRVLNYSPGAMDTDLQDEIRESPAMPAATHELFVSFKEKGQLVRAEDSALYCAQLTTEDKYASGTTIRFDPSKLVAREGLFP